MKLSLNFYLFCGIRYHQVAKMADTAMDNSGRLVKMEVDYSNTCDTKIPECKKLASEGKLHDALDQLLALEKLTRTVKYTLLQESKKYLYIYICMET